MLEVPLSFDWKILISLGAHWVKICYDKIFKRLLDVGFIIKKLKYIIM